MNGISCPHFEVEVNQTFTIHPAGGPHSYNLTFQHRPLKLTYGDFKPKKLEITPQRPQLGWVQDSNSSNYCTVLLERSQDSSPIASTLLPIALPGLNPSQNYAWQTALKIGWATHTIKRPSFTLDDGLPVKRAPPREEQEGAQPHPLKNRYKTLPRKVAGQISSARTCRGLQCSVSLSSSCTHVPGKI
jgi:hypothetical protein